MMRELFWLAFGLITLLPVILTVAEINVRMTFACCIGIYWNQSERSLYWFPLPGIGFVFSRERAR